MQDIAVATLRAHIEDGSIPAPSGQIGMPLFLPFDPILISN